MKHLNLIFALSLLMVLAVPLFGQSVQRGFVFEYNEKHQRVPLCNVEIVVTNAASTISDINGEFELHFRQLKPGDRIVVHHIRKSGYSVANESMLEQLFIMNDSTPISIQLIRTEKLMELRKDIVSKAGKKVDQQFEDDKRQLSINLKNKQIDEQQYQQKLTELQREYDAKLDNIQNYIDRFVYLDMSALSADEKQIVELVHLGEIDKAIALYDSHDLTHKLAQQESLVRNLRAASDEMARTERALHEQKKKLRNAVLRQADLLRIQGGADAHVKITNLLHDLAMADTTNVYNMLVYARQLQGMSNYDEARRVYESLTYSARMRHDSMTLLRAECYEANVLQIQGRFSEGIALAEHSLPLYDSLRLTKSDTLSPLRDVADFCVSLGTRYARLKNYRKAHVYFSRGLQSLRTLRRETKLKDIDSQYATSLVQCATYMRKSYWGDESIALANEAIRIFEELYSNRPYLYEARLAFAQNSLGLVYYAQKRNDEAENAFLESERHYRNSVERNPAAYGRFLATCLTNLSEVYIREREYNRALQCLEEAQKLWLSESDGATKYAQQLSEVNYDIGKCSYHLKDYQTALRCNLKSLQDMEPLYNAEPLAYRHKMCIRLVHLCNSYVVMDDLETAFYYAERAYKVEPEYFEARNNYERLKKQLGR